MAPLADRYAELGLQPSADEAAIRQAFRRLARELHPDRNPDPAAARAFVRVRAAYEALLDPAHRKAVEAAGEAAEVVEAMIRVAEAARPHLRTEPALRPLHFTLDTRRRGLPAAVAGRVTVALSVVAVGAVVLAALTGAAAFVLAGVASLVTALAVWLTRRECSELRLYGNGFEDGRWDGAERIRWGDVYALDPDYASGTLDLALSAPVAERLTGLTERPRDVLVWEGDRPFYRLPLGEQLGGVLAAVEARTGLRRPR